MSVYSFEERALSLQSLTKPIFFIFLVIFRGTIDMQKMENFVKRKSFQLKLNRNK